MYESIAHTRKRTREVYFFNNNNNNNNNNNKETQLARGSYQCGKIFKILIQTYEIRLPPMLGLIKVFKILSRKSSCRSPKHFLQKTLNGMSRNTLRDQSLFIAWRRGGGGWGPGNFGMKPASNICFPSRNGHFIMHSPEMDTKISCTSPPNFFTLHTPIIFSVVVCRIFFLYFYTFSVCSMYKCLKRLQENVDTNLWKTKNSSIKFKTHRYNTEFISVKTFDIEMNKNCLHHF